MDTPEYLVSMMHEDSSSFANEESFCDESIDFGRLVHVQSAHDLLETHLQVSNILFSNKEDVNVKVEQIEEQTADENVALEALQQLGTEHTEHTSETKVSLDKQEPSKCPNCKLDFPNMSSLKTHLECCKIYQFACKKCNESFTRRCDLDNHMVCHQVDRPYSCQRCSTLFIHKHDFVKHIMTHKVQTYMHHCKECPQQFTRPSSLTNHMKIHNYQPGRALVSERIEKISGTDELADILTGNDAKLEPDIGVQLPSIQNISIGNLNWHLNYESSELTVENMNLVDLNTNSIEKYDDFDDQDDDNNDIVIIVEDSSETDIDGDINADFKPFVCFKCSKSFAGEKELIAHRNNIHNQIDKDRDEVRKIERKKEGFTCTECDKSFKTKQKLSRHTWIHRKKSFTCEVCSLNFETQKLLDSHRLATHQSNTRYACNECGKNFSSRQGLWEHGRLHTASARHFYCEECDKTFTSRQGYSIHQRKHSGVRPYGCKYCYKSFKDGGTLTKHERIHTGERPYVCPVCTKAFNQKVVLREHLRAVHIVNIEADARGKFNCSLCDKCYGDKNELCAHFVQHSDRILKKAKAEEAAAEALTVNGLKVEDVGLEVIFESVESSTEKESSA